MDENQKQRERVRKNEENMLRACGFIMPLKRCPLNSGRSVEWLEEDGPFCHSSCAWLDQDSLHPQCAVLTALKALIDKS